MDWKKLLFSVVLAYIVMIAITFGIIGVQELSAGLISPMEALGKGLVAYVGWGFIAWLIYNKELKKKGDE